MFDALKKADAKASDVDAFLATLLSEHDVAGARNQLKTLWIGHARELFQEDEVAPVEPAAARGVRARAQTPPDSTPPPAESGAA